MTHHSSRRGFLGVAAAAVGGALAAPVICAGPAFAADGRRELPVVNHPDHPAAQYPARAARGPYEEPLNATVDCALSGRRS